MTYLEFHLVFILPVIIILIIFTFPLTTKQVLALLTIALIALLYTTPWDNYLVWRGIWSYPDGRVLATIGYVPLEEYLFFILQSVLTGLGLFLILKRTTENNLVSNLLIRHLPIAIYVARFIWGLSMLRHDATLYLGLILIWAMPILALQWALGVNILWRYRKAALLAVVLPTVYLWVCDRIAIGLEIWQLSPQYLTGLNIFGLPIEEAIFFLVTNLLVVKGCLLFLHWR